MSSSKKRKRAAIIKDDDDDDDSNNGSLRAGRTRSPSSSEKRRRTDAGPDNHTPSRSARKKLDLSEDNNIAQNNNVNKRNSRTQGKSPAKNTPPAAATAQKRNHSERNNSERNHSSRRASLAKTIENEENESEGDSELDLSNERDFSIDANDVAPHGIIESISVKNFMCHRNLSFQFGPNVNFVVGRNGSGKSAVLTAIIVGLGGKAAVTNRGRSVKTFIKTGTHSAEITIKLKNEGSDAYKHDVYGHSITIHRKLSMDGSSSYKIKSNDGKVISTKREELVHITDQFNIQVDNPISILNQDTSRNFMKAQTPTEKYKAFMKATQLEQMCSDYLKIMEQKNTISEILSSKKELLIDMHTNVKELEDEYRKLSNLQELEKKRDHLKNCIAWAHVAALEKELDPLNKAVRQEEARTPKFDVKVVQCQENIDACLKMHEHISKQLEKVSNSVEVIQPRFTTVREELKLKQRALKTSQLQARELQISISDANKEKKLLDDRIREIRSTAQQDSDRDRREREEKISDFENQLKDLEHRRTVVTHQMTQMQQNSERCNDSLKQIREEMSHVNSAVLEKERTVQELEGSKANSLRRFGRWTPALVKKIQEAASCFHHTPRGPVGASIQLKDKKWVYPVECCLRGSLFSFCCHDNHDAKVLGGIFDKVVPRDQRRPTIIISRFLDRKHDVSQHAVRSNEFPTVLDVLTIEDPVIANTLIDQRRVESVILIEDESVARRVMGHSPPNGCREAFAVDGSQIFAAPNFRYYSSNSRPLNILMANVDEQINGLSAEIREAKQRRTELKDTQQKVSAEAGNHTKQHRQTQTQLMKLQTEINKLTFEIEELRRIEDPTPVDIEPLEEELETCVANISDLQQQMTKKKESISETNAEFKICQQNYNERDQQLKELVEEAEPLKQKLGSTLSNIDKAKQLKRHYEDKKVEHMRTIDGCRTKVTEKQNEIKSASAKAAEICPEKIDIIRTVQNIANEIHQVEREIKHQKKSQGHKEDITRRFHQALEKFDQTKLLVKSQKRFLTKLDRSIHLRKTAYKEFQKYLGFNACTNFVSNLNLRGYEGRLVFNHTSQTLEVIIKPNQEKLMRASKDLRQLSGGERSFSTVCFILSLWEANGMPFQCLDEFDVFMDMVTRRITLDVMMQAALQKKNKQFIFLTPMDLSAVPSSPMIQLFRMPEPER